jgi:hypothetical protein
MNKLELFEFQTETLFNLIDAIENHINFDFQVLDLNLHNEIIESLSDIKNVHERTKLIIKLHKAITAFVENY